MTEIAIDKVLWVKPGQGIAAAGHIPVHSEIFKDHFPEFPVLPGVLALEMLKQTAERYLRESGSETEKFFLKKIHNAKFHTYLKPGDIWESRLELMASDHQETQWKAQLFHEGKLAVSAELVLSLVPIKNQAAI